jgi:polar amino acid transport system permease protein
MQSSDSALNKRGPLLAPQGMDKWPWWLLIALFLGLVIVYQILTNQDMANAFRAVVVGLGVTIRVTFLAYALAVVIGLLVGLARVSTNPVINNLASFYVEIVRGVPILVLLMYIAFVAVPLGVEGINSLGGWLLENVGVGQALAEFRTRDFPNEWRVVIALAFAYGAFESEVFRAGIQSIEKGQMEAARALGMNYFQAMRHIILPQAVRRILPALGNDFIAMLKDSSLVSALGVEDITQKAKLYAASTFLFFQTYSILAFIYLIMTVLLSRVVRWLETRMSIYRR